MCLYCAMCVNSRSLRHWHMIIIFRVLHEMTLIFEINPYCDYICFAIEKNKYLNYDFIIFFVQKWSHLKYNSTLSACLKGQCYEKCGSYESVGISDTHLEIGAALLLFVQSLSTLHRPAYSINPGFYSYFKYVYSTILLISSTTTF